MQRWADFLDPKRQKFHFPETELELFAFPESAAQAHPYGVVLRILG
jgi:hypothetical protein